MKFGHEVPASVVSSVVALELGLSLKTQDHFVVSEMKAFLLTYSTQTEDLSYIYPQDRSSVTAVTG